MDQRAAAHDDMRTISDTPISKAGKQDNIQAEHYLESIAWNSHEFTRKQLENMLVASCLRYLEGLTDITFVLELAGKIREKRQSGFASSELKAATGMLCSVKDRLLKAGSIPPGEADLSNLVDAAQEMISSRRYLTS